MFITWGAPASSALAWRARRNLRCSIAARRLHSKTASPNSDGSGFSRSRFHASSSRTSIWITRAPHGDGRLNLAPRFAFIRAGTPTSSIPPSSSPARAASSAHNWSACGGSCAPSPPTASKCSRMANGLAVRTGSACYMLPSRAPYGDAQGQRWTHVQRLCNAGIARAGQLLTREAIATIWPHSPWRTGRVDSCRD